MKKYIILFSTLFTLLFFNSLSYGFNSDYSDLEKCMEEYNDIWKCYSKYAKKHNEFDGQPTPAMIGDRFFGSIDHDGDIDDYIIELSKGDVITISIRFSKTHPCISLYKEGEKIGGKCIEYDYGLSYVFYPKSNGLYVFRIYNGYNSRTNNYTVDINCTDGPCLKFIPHEKNCVAKFTFENNILHIPCLQIENDVQSYWLDLYLDDINPITLKIIDMGTN